MRACRGLFVSDANRRKQSPGRLAEFLGDLSLASEKKRFASRCPALAQLGFRPMHRLAEGL